MKSHVSHKETFPQIGLVLGYFAITITGRDGDIAYALQIHKASKLLNDRCGDAFTTGRHLALSSLFIYHLTTPIGNTAEHLYAAIDESLISGDKHLMLSCIGSVATIKLFSGENVGEVDAYCSTAPEDLGDWAKDLRSGAWIVGCR